jgi:protein-S-isoprenylcysteine O-methyltransferase Ste14
VPAVYTLLSVERYFGFERAIGGDHFRSRYRQMPLVKQGAFKWSENAMYAFVFLLLWSIALFAGSWVALSLAVFQHVYVWAHYCFTEKPDMELIYYR